MSIINLKLRISLLAIAWALIVCVSPAAAQDEPNVLKMATGPAVGADFAVGRGMATLWSMTLAESDLIQCQAIVSPGSEENLSSLRLNKVDLAVLENLIANTSWQGTGLYQGAPFKELRSIFRLWPNVEYFILRGEKVDTGTIKDLGGQAVSAGMPGSGEFSALVILQAIGVNRSEMQLRYLLPFKAYRYFQSQKVAGLMISDGPFSYPVKYVMQVKENNPRLLEVSDEQLATINSTSPYKGFRFVVKAGKFPGQENDLKTIAQHNHLYCRAELDEQTVYKLTKVFFDQFGQWGNMDLGDANLEDPQKALIGLEVPLHVGAYRYFKENKIPVPDALIPPEAKQAPLASQQQKGE